jgi:hypothetical protein
VTLLPAIWRAGYRALAAPRARRFARALADPARAQAATLRRLIALLAAGTYTRGHGLRPGDGYAAFRDALPLVDYETLRPWVERQVVTGLPLLSGEAPLVYERTSGTSGRPKLVPYTPSLLAAFNNAFLVWSHDLVRRGPRLVTGRLFLSTSPSLDEGERTPTGVPISLADDTAYLAPRLQRLLHGCCFVPPGIKRIADPDVYRRTLAAIVVAEAGLEIVSVWSPTYLLALLDAVTRWREEIATDLRRGETGPPQCRVPLPPARAGRLALLGRDPIPWTELWPGLKLVSCWTDAASAAFVPALRAAFPTALIQGKGLLSTEAPVTIPLLDAPAPVPLLDEVFLEFASGHGEPRLLHELEDGAEYEVIVSQGGGLVRYRTGDRVRVAGRIAATPCLRFVGRSGLSSDLVGEKLGAEFVGAVLARVLGRDGHCSWLEAVRRADGRPGYACVTDHAAARAPEGAAELARRLEAELARAFHYRQARRLAQLAPLRLAYRADARRAFEAAQLARGVRWGNIKFAPLVTGPVT